MICIRRFGLGLAAITVFLLGCGVEEENIANEVVDIEHPTLPDIEKWSVPFEITEANNIKFDAVLNGVDTLSLYFDTGGTELVLRHDAIQNNTSLLENNEDYTEETYYQFEETNALTIGDMQWDSLAIYAVPVGPMDMDGHFGWDLFEGQVVELNYDEQMMTVSNTLGALPKSAVKLPIEFTHTLFCIQGTVKVNGQSFTERYLFDTGFQRAVILDRDMVKANHFPTDLPVISESKLRNSAGDEFINKVVLADAFCFEELCLDSVPVQLLSTPNPARFETHILGNEFLKRFNVVMDFKDGFVYLWKNSLVDESYIDGRES